MLAIIFPQPFIHSSRRTSNPVTVSNQSGTTSERGTLQTVMSEENDSLITPVTVSNQSERVSECETLLTVIDNQEEPVTVSNRSNKRRSKGYGTGRIQWRTKKTSSGKEYKQPWYDWQVNEGGKTKTRTKYIPKRLLARIQELEAEKASVQEVLRLLGVGEQLSPGRFEETSIKSPTKIRRKNNSPTKSKSPTKIRRKNSLPSQSKSPTKIRRKNNSPSESKSPTSRRGKNKLPASGHISPTIQRKNGKEYPSVQGERVPREGAWDYPEQFVWLYNWCVQDLDGCWKNRSKRVPVGKIYSVRSAIASNKPVEEILKLIEE